MKNRNLLKGIFLAVIGLAFGLGALRYPVGSLQRAGPGLFPLIVGFFLFLLAVAMIVRSHFIERVPMEFNTKNIAIILGSLAGFAILSGLLNMIAGTIFLVFFSTLAGTKYSLVRNALVTAVLIAIGLAFQKGLGLQLPLY